MFWTVSDSTPDQVNNVLGIVKVGVAQEVGVGRHVVGEGLAVAHLHLAAPPCAVVVQRVVNLMFENISSLPINQVSEVQSKLYPFWRAKLTWAANISDFASPIKHKVFSYFLE